MNIKKEIMHTLELSKTELNVLAILTPEAEPEKCLNDKKDIKLANHLFYKLWVGSNGKNEYTLHLSQKEFDILLVILTSIDIFECLDNPKDIEQASELIHALANHKLLALLG